MTAHFVNPEETLATELLREVKASAKRWFIAFVVMILVNALTLGGFIWYISTSNNTTHIRQNSRQNNTTNSSLLQNIGDDELWQKQDKSK